MRTNRFLLFTSNFFLAALALRAAVPLRFAADAETPRTHQASAYRGETLDIEARLLWRGAPLAVTDGAEAAMCWQTNGMGDAWWTDPASVTTGGVVTAIWSPSNDVGAASYRVFFRVAGPGGASYRANMLLRMLGSPGETPNALPLPAKVLDFARITYTNEPWASSSGLTTNDVCVIVGEKAGVRIGWFDGRYDWLGDSPTISWELVEGPFDGDRVQPIVDMDIVSGILEDEYGFASTESLAGYAARTNLPPLSADATVGDLVDTLNSVIGALRKDDEE